MKICSSVFFSTLVLLSQSLPAAAQTPGAAKKPATATKSAPKESLEAHFARQNFKEVLDAVDAAWFGKAYQGYSSVELKGNLGIVLSAEAVNAKINQLGEGAVKGGLTKGGNVSLGLTTTYLANSDFHTELTGDFGNLTYHRSGPNGFLASRDQNAYTTRIDPAPSDAPLFFQAWFRQCINELQAVYVDGTSFKATLGKDNAGGGLQTLTFVSPTGAYDPKKREQSLAESLGFWKRGKLEVVFDKVSKLPQQMNYSNDGQGVYTHMTFAYLPGGKVSLVTIDNQSKGMEGPAHLQMGYGENGLMSHLAGEMGFAQGHLHFDLDLVWGKIRKLKGAAPSPLAKKKDREELESLLLMGMAKNIMNLQTSGFNLRSVKITN